MVFFLRLALLSFRFERCVNFVSMLPFTSHINTGAFIVFVYIFGIFYSIAKNLKFFCALHIHSFTTLYYRYRKIYARMPASKLDWLIRENLFFFISNLIVVSIKLPSSKLTCRCDVDSTWFCWVNFGFSPHFWVEEIPWQIVEDFSLIIPFTYHFQSNSSPRNNMCWNNDSIDCFHLKLIQNSKHIAFNYFRFYSHVNMWMNSIVCVIHGCGNIWICILLYNIWHESWPSRQIASLHYYVSSAKVEDK